MTEQEQIEYVAAAHDQVGQDWAKDEMELRQRAVAVVDHAFRDFDGRHCRPVEVSHLPISMPQIGELGTMPVQEMVTWKVKRIQLWPGLDREEAILIAEEWLRS